MIANAIYNVDAFACVCVIETEMMFLGGRGICSQDRAAVNDFREKNDGRRKQNDRENLQEAKPPDCETCSEEQISSLQEE